MENLFLKKVPLYFETEESQLILGDSFKILTKMEPESVDMIFADPPYFLSNDGITCQGGKMVSVNNSNNPIKRTLLLLFFYFVSFSIQFK